MFKSNFRQFKGVKKNKHKATLKKKTDAVNPQYNKLFSQSPEIRYTTSELNIMTTLIFFTFFNDNISNSELKYFTENNNVHKLNFK